MEKKDTEAFRIDIDEVLSEFDEINKDFSAKKREEEELKVEIREEVQRELDMEISEPEGTAESGDDEGGYDSSEDDYDQAEDDYDEDDYDEEDYDQAEDDYDEEDYDQAEDDCDIEYIDIDENEDEIKDTKAKVSGKKILLTGIVVVVLASLAVLAFFWVRHKNTIALKSETVQVEYGTNMDKNIKNYVQGNTEGQDLKVDISLVDTMNEGTYEAYVVTKEKKLPFKVIVKDTIAPEVATKEDIRVTVGTELSSDAVADLISDAAGVASITFKENMVQEGSVDVNQVLIPALCRYDQTGVVANTLYVTDENGNVTEKSVSIYVTEDYAARVQQITDKVILENAEGIDYMKDIAWDESIASVTCDSSAVNIAGAGQYPITYVITANDAASAPNGVATTVAVTKTVDIVTAEVAQSKVDEGAVVYTSNNVVMG